METCLEAFGPSRCMFESNFPQEKPSCSYNRVLETCAKKLPLAYNPTSATTCSWARPPGLNRLDLPAAAYGVQQLDSERQEQIR